MKKIVLTGGGTAGHVTPNIALIPALKKEGYEIYYIGSYDGIEKAMIEKLGIPYIGIASGKLRRYFSVKNFTDPFRVLKGFSEAKKAIQNIQPDIVFSKGGFVTVPVVYAAKKLGIPVMIHESDMTPGLAIKLSIPKADRICANFPETVDLLPKGKAILTGIPIRVELLKGNREKGLAFLGFPEEKPILLVMGGSLGSLNVNQAVRGILDGLTEKFNVVHLCGKGKLDESLLEKPGYRQFEYLDKELRDVFATADLAVSRAGANAIFELLAKKLPNLLIPLSIHASRGDQILNAKSFKKQGFSDLLLEEDMTEERLLEKINRVYEQRESYKKNMENSTERNAIEKIIGLIQELSAEPSLVKKM